MSEVPPGGADPVQGPHPAPPAYGTWDPSQPGVPAWGAPQPDTDLTGPRALQYLFDSLVALVGVVPGALLFIGAAVAESGATLLLAVVLFVVGSYAASFWVFVLRPVRHHGQTYGMSMLEIRVVDAATLGEATTGQQAIRWLLLLLVDGGVLGLLLIAITDRHQRLGDMAAKTLVVRVDDPVVAAARGQARPW